MIRIVNFLKKIKPFYFIPLLLIEAAVDAVKRTS
jgi:hypothetical protein